jgi:hypothetical protein
MYKDHFFHRLTWCALFMIVLLTGCSHANNTAQNAAPSSTTGPHASTAVSAPVNQESTIRFSLSGGKSASYILHAATPISMLRHGHREFTIDIVDAKLSIFIVFYGYQGPGNYTLAKTTNGGDVHFSLGDAAPAWDLSLQPQASCALAVQRDAPTALAGLDRMQGTLTCLRLFSSNPIYPQSPVTLQNGSFDLAMLVES